MQVRVLGAHNLETDSTHHTCFLIDGVLAIDAGSLVSTLSPDEQVAMRHVLLTHLHFDHTRDIPTLGLATLDDPTTIDVYSLGITLASVRNHLIDGEVYPRSGHPVGDQAARVRRVLHDQAARTGHGHGAGHHLEHRRQPARWRHTGGVQPRQNGVHRSPAHLALSI